MCSNSAFYILVDLMIITCKSVSFNWDLSTLLTVIRSSFFWAPVPSDIYIYIYIHVCHKSINKQASDVFNNKRRREQTTIKYVRYRLIPTLLDSININIIFYNHY